MKMLSVIALAATLASPVEAATTISIDTSKPGTAISPDLVGVFFEDINYAADGGLYAELVQNRSFEYQATEQPTWNNLTFWTLDKGSDAKAGLFVDDTVPVADTNPHYAILEVNTPGSDGVKLINPGYDGIPVSAGESYRFSIFTRELFSGGRWDPVKAMDPLPLTVQIVSESGKVLGQAQLTVSSETWQQQQATITVEASDATAHLALVATQRGGIALDEVSLFPVKTFHDRPNGMRADLGQAIADLHPKFIRFPGGCLVHGAGLNNLYKWKDTIGPVEQRVQQRNLWGYHQSVGLGFYEYFQFAEDIGAKPLPVVAAGVCCQNADHKGGTGQQGLPMNQMPDYVQDVLDLIEYANGPVTSTWGAKRAAAGHPAPFNLQYIGVGNEDHITPLFKIRFKMIQDAIKKRYPDITIVGTVGPMPDGEDFDEGWKIADELHVDMVDEHYYQSPEWFWDHLDRYDHYDRSKSKVYVGEYAAHEKDRSNTLRTALAEAAHLTSLERNGDVVHMASYAPLLAREKHTQWRPDMIYFTGTELLRSVNYYVQQMFGQNSGDHALPLHIDGLANGKRLAVSSVRDSHSGDLIVKIVNGEDSAQPLRLDLQGWSGQPQAELSVLSGKADTVDSWDHPTAAIPKTSAIKVGSPFEYNAPAESLSVIRLHR